MAFAECKRSESLGNHDASHASTEFNNATIDDPQFIDYITQYTRNIPQKIKDKKKLRRELARKGVSEENIEDLLTISRLPEE